MPVVNAARGIEGHKDSTLVFGLACSTRKTIKTVDERLENIWQTFVTFNEHLLPSRTLVNVGPSVRLLGDISPDSLNLLLNFMGYAF